MISAKLSDSVLTVGEDYRTPKGGISGVINTYSRYFPNFKFVSTYNPAVSKFLNPFIFIKGILLLINRLLFDRKIKIVHIHGAHYGSFFRKYLVFLIAKNVFSKKVIYHSHGSDFHSFYNEGGAFTRRLIRSFIQRLDLLICLSNNWKIFFEEHFIIKKIIILENIVEKPQITNVNSTKTYLQVLFLGMIGERKGIFDLLEVVKDNQPYFEGKMRLVIGGNGEVMKLKKFIKDHQLENIVVFEGWISGSKKQALFSGSDVYILPSYNEGLPVSILEAMSYKLPIISTNVGGIPEILYDGVNGYVINPGDKKALFNSLKAFLDEPGLVQQMGNKSERLIMPYYAEVVIPKLQSIYAEIIN
jgi:glycosyltransferase involved in cell wall biosynthesis